MNRLYSLIVPAAVLTTVSRHIIAALQLEGVVVKGFAWDAILVALALAFAALEGVALVQLEDALARAADAERKSLRAVRLAIYVTIPLTFIAPLVAQAQGVTVSTLLSAWPVAMWILAALNVAAPMFVISGSAMSAAVLRKADEQPNADAIIAALNNEVAQLTARVNHADEQRKALIAQWKDRKGFVYIVVREDGLYKIGMARNVARRLTSLGAAARIELVHQFPCKNRWRSEREMHMIFAGKRKHGEWFALTPEDIEAIRQVQSSDDVDALGEKISAGYRVRKAERIQLAVASAKRQTGTKDSPIDHEVLARKLAEEPMISSTELAELFGVSPSAIRQSAEWRGRK